MKKKEWRKGPLIMLLLGGILALTALAMLAPVKDVLQYAIAAPDGEDEVLRLVKAKREADASLMDCTEVTAIGGAMESASVSADGKSGTAAVYAVGEGWFEIYPVFLVQGRRITETELARGDKVARNTRWLERCAIAAASAKRRSIMPAFRCCPIRGRRWMC